MPSQEPVLPMLPKDVQAILDHHMIDDPYSDKRALLGSLIRSCEHLRLLEDMIMGIGWADPRVMQL